jgi:hypothetical protein
MENGFRESVHHEAPPFKFHYQYFFFSVIQVVSYVVSCAEPAESDSNSAYTAEAGATRRQNGFAITNESVDSRRGSSDIGSEYIVILGACKLPRRTCNLRQREAIY